MTTWHRRCRCCRPPSLRDNISLSHQPTAYQWSMWRHIDWPGVQYTPTLSETLCVSLAVLDRKLVASRLLRAGCVTLTSRAPPISQASPVVRRELNDVRRCQQRDQTGTAGKYKASCTPSFLVIFLWVINIRQPALHESNFLCTRLRRQSSLDSIYHLNFNVYTTMGTGCDITQFHWQMFRPQLSFCLYYEYRYFTINISDSCLMFHFQTTATRWWRKSRFLSTPLVCNASYSSKFRPNNWYAKPTIIIYCVVKKADGIF